MFFNAVYKLPIWKNIDNKSRNIRLLVLGAVFYVIVHSFLYSKYVENIELIENNKKYLYYLMIIDLGSVGLLMFMNDSKKIKKKKTQKKQRIIKRKILPPIMPFGMENVKLSHKNIKQNPIGVTKPINHRPTIKSNQNIDNDSIKLPIYSSKNKKLDNDDCDIPIYDHHNEINANDEEIPIYNNQNKQYVQINNLPNVYV